MRHVQLEGLSFRERRRFRVWGMDKTVPVEPKDVYERVDHGRIEVHGPEFDEPLPVKSAEDLAELAYFTAGHGTVADLPTAQALKALSDLGWSFQIGENSVGAYGAYNNMGDEELVAVNDKIREPLDSGSLIEWANATEHSEVARLAGHSAYLLTEGLPSTEAVERLVEAGQFRAAAALIAPASWSEGLPPKVQALTSLALQKHPDDLAKVAKSLFSNDLSDWEREKAGDAILRLAPEDEPVSQIMKDIWERMPVAEPRGKTAAAVWPHLGTGSPEKLRKIGLEAMASVDYYYVQRAHIGSVFCKHVAPPERKWLAELGDKLSAEQSQSPIYRACLNDSATTDAARLAQALSMIDYNRDGAIVGRAALTRLQGDSVKIASEMIDDNTYETHVQALALGACRATQHSGDLALQAFALEGLRAFTSVRTRDYHEEIAFSKRMADRLAHTELGKVGQALAHLTPSRYDRPANLMKEVFARPLKDPIDARFIRGLAKYFPDAGPEDQAVKGLKRLHKELANSPFTTLQELAAALELSSDSKIEGAEVELGQDYLRVGDFEVEVSV